jgi:phenylacetic acid degradation operon negative regulatory protein
MMDEGLFNREGRGRQARYVATARGKHELRDRLERARRAFDQDAHACSTETWDGQWRIVGFEVPEQLRHARDELRALLASFGAAGVQGGVYITPHAVAPGVLEAAARLRLAPHVFVVTTDHFAARGTSDPRELARRLWPLDDLATRYRRLVRHFGPVVDRTRALVERGRKLDEKRFIPRTLSMAAAFMAVHDDDPLLPPELLPQPWPGSEARSLARDARVLARRLREQPGASTLFSFFDEVMADPDPPVPVPDVAGGRPLLRR